MKKILILGAGGFIGSNLVTKHKSLGNYVVGADLKYPDFSQSLADEFYLGDLREREFVSYIFKTTFDEVYQLAADMGGAGYLFIGKNDADIMHNSTQININILNEVKHQKIKVFFSSSACVYPQYNQNDEKDPICSEETVYPAFPDSEYGWEKIYAERLYQAYEKNFGLKVRIARFHNIFGPNGTYEGGKEKSVAALCRKVILSKDKVEIWGDGNQTRTFLYIDECIEGIIRIMESEINEPVNLGSENLISINKLFEMICSIENKQLLVNHIKGPLGVRGRRSDNKLILSKLGWKPRENLEEGLEVTYNWIKSQIGLKNF